VDTDRDRSLASPRLLPILTAALLSVAAALGVIVATSLFYALAPRLRGNLPFAAVVECAVYFGAALAIVRAARPPGAAAWLGFERVDVQLVLIGIGLGFALHGPADFVEGTMERWFAVPQGELAERALRLSPPGTLARALNLLTIAGLVPIAEEAFFRGALFRALGASVGIGAAFLTTGALFTLSHPEPRSWPALALISGALGAVRLFSGSLLPAILLHATFNATTLLVIFVQPPRGATAPSWAFLGLGGVMSALFLLLARRRWLARGVSA
jgi:membrane protease YdiL (CAAX protease family)